MANSSIEWTEMTWNPTTGCTKISAGCKFCYAEIMTRRLKAMGQEKYKYGFKIVKTHSESLEIPYTWKTPKIVFVNSMSDLFHKDVPLDYIKKVFKHFDNGLLARILENARVDDCDVCLKNQFIKSVENGNKKQLIIQNENVKCFEIEFSFLLPYV